MLYFLVTAEMLPVFLYSAIALFLVRLSIFDFTLHYKRLKHNAL